MLDPSTRFLVAKNFEAIISLRALSHIGFPPTDHDHSDPMNVTVGMGSGKNAVQVFPKQRGLLFTHTCTHTHTHTHAP